MVSALKGALEDEYETERRGVQKEFEIACEVQSRLLPSQAPDYPRLDFGFFYQPAREVGGDYYDFIPFNPEHMGLAVGDVCGKGLSSSLLMASLQGLVRTNLAVRQGEVARFVTELNDSIVQVDRQQPVCDVLFRRRRRFRPNAPLCQRRAKSAASVQERHVAGARPRRGPRDWRAEGLRSGFSREANIGPSMSSSTTGTFWSRTRMESSKR